MKKFLPFALLCGAFFYCAPVCGQETPAAPTVEELSKEVEALKKKTTTWQKVVEKMPKISGYLQLGYQWSETESTFFIKRARVNFQGDILRDKIDYRLQLEFASSPKIVDAYLRFKPFDELNFQIGEYKIPFTIENTDYVPLKVELIEYPLSLQKLMGFNDICGLSATGRDMGASMYGGFIKRDGYSIINYDFGVFNGEGLNVKDKNKSKDVVGRVTLKPVKGLQISGSYYWGEYGAEYRKRIRYTAGASYDRGRIVVRSEWIGGVTGMPDADKVMHDMTSDGWYALGGFRVTKSLMPVFRYDTFRQNVDVAGTRQTNYTLGCVWQPIKYLRCQLNYTYEDYTEHASSNRNVVALMLTGMF